MDKEKELPLCPISEEIDNKKELPFHPILEERSKTRRPSLSRHVKEHKKRRRSISAHDKQLLDLGLTTDSEHSVLVPLGDVLNKEEQAKEIQEELKFKREHHWKSCGGCVIDNRATQYFVQVGFGGIVVVWCLAKIWGTEPPSGCNGEDLTVYFTLLSGTLGYFFPSPSIKKK